MTIKPYVYKLTHKENSKIYIGARWANKKPAFLDLGIEYFTSSKIYSFQNKYVNGIQILQKVSI